MEQGSYLIHGGSHVAELSEDGTSLSTDLAYFASDAGLLDTLVLYPDIDEDAGYSFNWYATQLSPGDYDFLDIPVASGPEGAGNLSSTFTWGAIDGVDRYGLFVTDEDGAQTYWTILSDNGTEVTLPELPSTYDPSQDWPDEGTAGGFQVVAWQNPFAESETDEAYEINAMESGSSLYELTLGRN